MFTLPGSKYLASSIFCHKTNNIRHSFCMTFHAPSNIKSYKEVFHILFKSSKQHYSIFRYRIGEKCSMVMGVIQLSLNTLIRLATLFWYYPTLELGTYSGTSFINKVFMFLFTAFVESSHVQKYFKTRIHWIDNVSLTNFEPVELT